jgi:glycosyltransferase involved in cell wall biosynthesis
MSIAAIIPAYNEASNIKEVVRRTKAVGRFAEIIVVDDGSSDDTAMIAEKVGATVLRHKKNMGKGEALKTGFSYVIENVRSVKHVVLIDADLQFAPEEAPKLLEPLLKDEADFVMGARDWSKVPFRHRLGNWVWRTAFNVLFGTRLSDTNNGFMALNREAMEVVIPALHGGYIIENSALAAAVKAGIRIANVSVNVKYKHASKIGRGIRVEAAVLLYILATGFRYRLGR